MRRRCSPGDFNTKARQRRRERAAFAQALAPVLRALARRGVRANPDVAAELERRGVASESGGAWTFQAVASVRHRLAVMAAAPRPVRPRRPRQRQSVPHAEGCG